MKTITVITTKAKGKVLGARAGIKPVPPIIYMAFGDGGREWVPTGTDNALRNELCRKAVTEREKLSDTQYRYKCLLERDELPDTIINELGLIDEEGDFVCIIVCADKGKEEDVEMEFYIDDIME